MQLCFQLSPAPSYVYKWTSNTNKINDVPNGNWSVFITQGQQQNPPICNSLSFRTETNKHTASRTLCVSPVGYSSGCLMPMVRGMIMVMSITNMSPTQHYWSILPGPTQYPKPHHKAHMPLPVRGMIMDISITSMSPTQYYWSILPGPTRYPKLHRKAHMPLPVCMQYLPPLRVILLDKFITDMLNLINLILLLWFTFFSPKGLGQSIDFLGLTLEQLFFSP